MNFGELKTAILADAHRGDLTAHVGRFVRLCEAMIATRLQASEMDATVTLDDTDRSGVDSGLYTLPSGVLQVRRVMHGDTTLEPVSVNTIRRRGGSQSPFYYAVLGATRLEVRGIPAADAELELDYWGRFVALSADGDTNVVLTNHEGIYMHGGLHYLRRHTEDWEMADAELAMFNNLVDALNEQSSRKIGNAGAAPAYDFGGGGGY